MEVEIDGQTIHFKERGTQDSTEYWYYDKKEEVWLDAKMKMESGDFIIENLTIDGGFVENIEGVEWESEE
ncbi:hypothetical protein N9Z85_06705 [Akkermansiaceae bacterium]|nr:hypothetical protein [Akkermansiaceae bacterium]